MEFDVAFHAHLDAVKRRDLDGYLATVHSDVTVVLPNGKVIAGRDEVAEFHRGWFADLDWKLTYAVERSFVVGDTGVAVVAVDYDDLDADGAPYAKRYILSLVFARHESSWLLVHDQNTFC